MPEVLDPPKTHQRPTDAIRRKMRADFVAGNGSGPQLALQYNIARNTVRDWIDKEGWQKLKEERERLELSRLNTYPEHIEKYSVIHEAITEPVTVAAKLKAHLERIDSLLETEQDAKNIAQLMRARGDAEEQLCIKLNGAKPGTMRPSRQNQRRSSPSIQDSPEPVQAMPEPEQSRPSQYWSDYC